MFERERTEHLEWASGSGDGSAPAATNPWETRDTTPRHILPPGLENMRPGPALASTLASVDRSSLNGYELVILLQAESRQAAHYHAAMQRSMHQIAHSPAGFAGSPAERVEIPEEFAADDIRAALRWTRRAAETSLDLAIEVIERFPLVWKELSRGRIDLPKVKVIVHTLRHLEERHIRRIEEKVVPLASDLTTGQLSARLRRMAISCDPESARDDLQRGLDDRRVVCDANPDGTANIHAYNLPPLSAHRTMRRIERIARSAKTRGDDRTADQRRADVFLDLLFGRQEAIGSNETSAEAQSNGSVELRVDLTTLAGLDQSPAEIPGWGPVVADIARQVTHGQTWKVAVTDPHTGGIIWSGVTRRRPDTAQRRHVSAENPTCVFPGCRMPAGESDIDHTHPWAEGGETSCDNLGPLCRHDHRAKHDGKWQLRRLAPGSFEWTSRLGHTYRTGTDPPIE